MADSDVDLLNRRPRRVAILAVEGIEILDLAGPQSVFAEATVARPGSYEIRIVGFRRDPIKSCGGATLIPDDLVADCTLVDTLVIPGGADVRRLKLSPSEAEALRCLAKRARRVLTICTGAFLFAQVGLLDGRRIATHWRHARELAANYPTIQVDGQQLYIQDGDLWSSGGVTAGIDLALAIVKEDFGAALAATVARELVVYLQRPGTQDQFSKPLAFQTERSGAFGELIQWMIEHPNADLSVDALSNRMGMSPRTFARAFKANVAVPPAHFVERLRLDLSRRLLEDGDRSIEAIARFVGFNSADSFRRSFERAFRVAPSFYRNRFASKQSA